MKKIPGAVFMMSCIMSCNLVADWNKSADDSLSMVSEESHYAFRDMSITPENSYSDLFLDSVVIENYIRKNQLPDSTARHMRNFYLVRNYQYAWLASDGFTEEGRTIHSAFPGPDTISRPETGTSAGLDTLLQQDSMHVVQGDSLFLQAELSITENFIKNAYGLFPGHPRAIYFYVPVKKQDAMQLADSILNRQQPDAQPGGQAYQQLKQQLGVYYQAARNGGWQPVNSSSFRIGQSSPEVRVLKKRLQATQDYHSGDSTDIYSDSLAMAVKEVERRFGLQQTGIAGDSLLRMLNIPAETRMEQILLNMKRMAWMENTDSSIVIVNIPDYNLYIHENGQRVMTMPVIVGKQGTNTTMFTGQLNEIVFSPAWNIPTGIVRDEILPKLAGDPDYLRRNNMERVNGSDSMPQIRQKPGGDNPMGRVKFLFPNSFDIYLHDTPDRKLFEKNERAFSHGCIRVADAQKLAEYLLRNEPEWTSQRIRQAMNSGNEQRVRIADPLPVIITYQTAWVDETGKMNFREDVYGHDQRAAARLFSGRGLISPPTPDSARRNPAGT